MRRTVTLNLLVACLAGVVVFGAACRGRSVAGEERGTTQIFAGKLKSGFMGIGGEHTGWMLLRGGKDLDLEVDVSGVQAKELDGAKVKVSGTFFEKPYVERGTVRIFRIESIQAAPP